MNNVINDLVGYDKLKIVQNSDYFNFSLESVLLPRFCHLKSNMKIIDLCSGNCPIPLIISQYTNSKIIAVELQKEIYDLAKQTIQINNLEDRIILYNVDAKKTTEMFETDSFDLITCNPPYFKYTKESNVNKNNIKSIARHEIEISLEDIILISRKLLKNNGSLCLVHRTDRLCEVIDLCSKYNLEVKRIQLIYPKSGENSNLMLIDARKNGKVGLKVLPPLICHNKDGSYTKEILKQFER